MSWERKVRDIMEVIPSEEVHPDSRLSNVLKTIFAAEERGRCNPTVLVREGDSIVGTVNGSDILNALQPSYTRGSIKMEIFWEGLLTEQWHNIARRNVKDVMRSPVTVDVNDNLMKVSHKMIKHNAGLVLVTDSKRLLGAVSMNGLFRELDIIGEEEKMASAGSM